MRHLFLLSLPLAAAALCLSTHAHAQGGATQPGRVERDTRPAPEPFKRDSVRIDAPRYAEEVPAGAQDVRFVLGDVLVSGNKAIATPALEPIWAGKLGKTVTLAEAFGIASAISARYRAAGYLLSQAIVPAQDIRTTGVGSLRIEVIEGFIDKVSFSGMASAKSSDKLKAYMEPVQRERPLRLATLERSLLLIGELAGVSAQANLRPSDTPGASDLEIVINQTRTDFSLSAHNRSTPSQGRGRYEAGADFRGVLGSFDRHNLHWATSGNRRLNLLGYSAEMPVGSNGLKLQLGASASRSEPDTGVSFSNIDTRSNNYSLGMSYPMLRSRQSNFALRSALNGYNNNSDVAGTRLSEDHIRALRIGLTADHADGFGGLSLLDLEWSKGLSSMGASQPGDPLVDSNPQFSKLTAYAARLQTLGGNWSLLLAVTAQTSSDKLPTAEQLGLGGDTFLRAFDPSEAIGEKGAATKLELRWDLGGGRFASTLYTYFDAGSVRRRQTSGGDVSTSLSSSGLGIRMSGPRRTRGYLEVAKPGRKDVASEGNRNARLFGGFGIDF